MGRRCIVEDGGRRCSVWFFFSWRNDASSFWMLKGVDVVAVAVKGAGAVVTDGVGAGMTATVAEWEFSADVEEIRVGGGV